MVEDKKDDKNTNELEELKSKCEEYLNGWKRERADFLNYKKEEMERIEQLTKYANEEIILKMLPVLDNFCLAEKHLPDGDEFKNGFSQIKKQLEDFLKKEGIEELKTEGQEFNPSKMDVAEEIESDAVKPGFVVEEVQKGYTIHGKLIRPARVKIAK